LPLHDPSQDLLLVVQNEMSFEQEHVELLSQEPIINSSQELAQKPLQDTCVNDGSESPEEPCDKLLQEMSQDVCD